MDPDFAEIRALAATLHDLHRQRVAALTPIVQSLIRTRSRDAGEIEHTLDHLFDCACIPEGLALFKALSRATAASSGQHHAPLNRRKCARKRFRMNSAAA